MAKKKKLEEGDLCPRCRCCDLVWEECENCDEFGMSSHDCGEDTCCCLDPEDNERCDICEGKHGWLICGGSCDENGQHQKRESGQVE